MKTEGRMRGLGRWIVAAASLALAVLSIVQYAGDRAGRRGAIEFVSRYHVEERRPNDARAIRNARTSESAAEVAAEVAVNDAAGGVDLSGLGARERALWLENAGDLPAELRDVRPLVLSALRSRPGWPYLSALAGMTAYELAARSVSGRPDPASWLVPLQTAVAAAPGDFAIAAYTAGAILSPPALAPPHAGSEERSIFRTAMHDAAFVEQFLPALIGRAGHESALALLPDEPASLRAALRVETARGDVSASAGLVRRLDAAEWQDRRRDLEEIERLRSLGDRHAVEQRCREWVRDHDPFAFDVPQAHAQAARVLQSWPPVPGIWKSDPRRRLVTYLMARTRDPRVTEALARAVEALAGVPDPIRARAAAMAGDLYEAERIHRDSGGGTGFEWTPYLLAAARSSLASGDPETAVAALGRLAPAARRECDSLLVLREVAFAQGQRDAALPVVRPAVFDPADWGRGSIVVCIDPLHDRTLAVTLQTDAATLLQYGFDGARLGTLSLPPGLTRLRVPLGGREGRHMFALQPFSGATVTPLAARLTPL